jgi:DNA-binding CsgD family transcriptional regulator
MNRIPLPELKGLSGVQRTAILLLVEGQNTSDVAAQCGIDRKTLYNWCHHNARFQFCLEATRSRLEPQDLDAEIPPISPDFEFSPPDPPKTPRNAFCPRGSGGKYKRCCGKGEPRHLQS